MADIEQNIEGLDHACDEALRDISDASTRFRLAGLLTHAEMPFNTPSGRGQAVDKMCAEGAAMAEHLRSRIFSTENITKTNDPRLRLVADGISEMQQHLLALRGAIEAARE